VSDLLMVNDEVDATEISVLVKDGVVTLSGVVQGRLEKRIAESIADSVAGVIDVNNTLSIGRLTHGKRVA
jgi:osmotically-inducible protein OsmY